MDLKSGYPYWAVKNGLMHAFPRLDRDLRCDVAIIGGGITGALIADELSRHGHGVAVFEQRDVAWGSTAASTALLQYEIDTHMTELAERYGEADGVLAYRACAEALDTIAEIVKPLRDVDHAKLGSLYYASKRRHVRALTAEFALRQRHGFAVTLLDREALHAQYAIDAPLAILSAQAARVDPYRLAYRLLARVEKAGGQVFDRTVIEHFEADARGVQLTSSEGHRVRAKHLVLAAGYANQRWLKQRVCKNRSSYAFISDPVDADELGWLAHTMAWESARPYLYVRSTGDGRVLVGGEDDAVDVPRKRDARVDSKAATLLERIHALQPQLDLTPAFAWAGTFAETADGLPFFGPHAQHGSRVLFAMAYGGNGITYSAIGAGLLRALVERRKHPLAQLFSFARLER